MVLTFIVVAAFIFLIGCRSSTPSVNELLTSVPAPNTPAYDTSPESVVVSVLARIEPGALPPTVPGQCTKPTVPILRIYGDGYAFVNDPPNQASTANMRSGLLKPNTVRVVLAYLNQQGFFDGRYEAAPVNPAGTGIDWRVNVAGNQYTYGEGAFNPTAYTTVVSMVKSELKPLAQQSTLDRRIDAIIRDEYCDLSP